MSGSLPIAIPDSDDDEVISDSAPAIMRFDVVAIQNGNVSETIGSTDNVQTALKRQCGQLGKLTVRVF